MASDTAHGPKDIDSSDQSPRFRDTEPVELWSTSFNLSVARYEFEEIMERTVEQTDQGFTGFITSDETGNVVSFTVTRYPRSKYGVTSVDDCEAGVAVLAKEFSTNARPDVDRSGFRVVMGLQEGYDAQSPIHTADEVGKWLQGASVSSAEVFAIRPTEEGVSTYTEPVAIIEAPLDMLGEVYDIGDRLRQERFTVEDFEQQMAHVVETRFCTEPD